MPPSNLALAEQQFDLEIKRLETERGLINDQAYLMVAAAVISHNATKVDPTTITRAVNLFAANADTESYSLDLEYKKQLARMKKYNILKLHQARMNTHTILSHFASNAFKYYEVRANTDFLLKLCILSAEVMGPGVEMVRLNCPAPNGDLYHVFSVGALGVWLAKMIKQGRDHWMEFACCPVCAINIPACESESTAFDLVKESGGHGMDYKHAIMFDFETMHAEVDDVEVDDV